MLLPFLRRGLRLRAPADDRLGRLRKGLDRAKVAYSADAPELALGRLPLADAPASFSARLPLERFRFPLTMPERVAMFEGSFLPDGAVRRFSALESHLLADYVPEALVVPLRFALTLADQEQRHLLEMPRLTTAVVVLTSLADGPLADHHRDLLWRSFGVPVFEQLRGWDGAVIARECEVHDGLHVDDSAAILEVHEGELIATPLTGQQGPMVEEPILRARTGLTVKIVTEHCECGAEKPRLKNLAVLRSRTPKVRMAVAS